MVHLFVRQEDILATLVTAGLEDAPERILGALEGLSKHFLFGLLAQDDDFLAGRDA